MNLVTGGLYQPDCVDPDQIDARSVPTSYIPTAIIPPSYSTLEEQSSRRSFPQTPFADTRPIICIIADSKRICRYLLWPIR